VIRVAVVDDHPALRAGLQTVLDSEPHIVYVGGSDGSDEHVWPMLNLVRPDVVLLDYHLPRSDGLQLCYRIKREVPAPRVIIFTAYASPTLALPARLARADGILAKGAGARDLFNAIRLVDAGEEVLPPISLKVLEEASAELLGDDRAVVAMLLDGASEADVAQALRMPPRDVRQAVQRILGALRLDVPAAQGTGTRL
jgi:DNA-binding NarL/FixJ family response regulator